MGEWLAIAQEAANVLSPDQVATARIARERDRPIPFSYLDRERTARLGKVIEDLRGLSPENQVDLDSADFAFRV